MFEKMNIDDFLSKTQDFLDSKDEVLAVSLITPSQSVHAKLDTGSEEYLSSDYEFVHEDIFDYCLGELYRIGMNMDVRHTKGREIKRKEIGNIITNRTSNFVAVRYIINFIMVRIIFEIPAFITSYQFDELVKLNEKVKRSGFDICVSITDYIPVLVSKDRHFDVQIFEEKENISLDMALDYLMSNGRIVDYALPFGEEKPFYEEGLEKIA